MLIPTGKSENMERDGFQGETPKTCQHGKLHASNNIGQIEGHGIVSKL